MPLLFDFVKNLKKVETKFLQESTVIKNKKEIFRRRLICSTLYDNEAFSAVNNTYSVINMIPTQKHLQIP